MSSPRFDTAAVVLGMHRSGTSALAGLLCMAGFAPPRTLLKSSSTNVRGFWESERIKEFNDGILNQLGASWHGVEPVVADRIDGRVLGAMRRQAGTILAREFEAGANPLIKDPRMCRLLDVWRPEIDKRSRRTVYAVIVRNPLEVARSLGERNGFDPSLGLMLWARYLLDAEHKSRDCPRTFVSYSGLLDNWTATLGSISDALELGLEPKRLNRPAVAQFLSADLRHHRVVDGQAFVELEKNPFLVDLYRILLDWAHGRPPARDDYTSLDEARLQLDRLSGILSQMFDQARLTGKRLATARKRADEAAADLSRAHHSLEEFEGFRLTIETQTEAVRSNQQSLAAQLGDFQAAVAVLTEAAREQRTLEEALAESIKAQAAMRAEIDEIRGDSARAAAEYERDRAAAVARHEQEIENLRTDLEQRCRELDQATATANELGPLRAELVKLQEELKRIKRKYRAAQDHFTRERDAHRETGGRLADAEAALAARRRWLQWLPSGLGTIRRNIRSAADRLSGRNRRRLKAEVAVLDSTPLFDRSWYLGRYQDVAEAGLDPAFHYLRFGWREGRDPGPSFSTSGYLKANADVSRAGINPLLHFIEFGLSEGRGLRHHPRISSAPKPPPGEPLGEAAPCASFPVAQDQPVRWRRAARLPLQEDGAISAAGLPLGFSGDPGLRAAVLAEFAKLAGISGWPQDALGDVRASGLTKDALMDAWFVSGRRLRTRWQVEDQAIVVRAFQHDPGRDGMLAMVAEGLAVSPLDFIDASLVNPFFPLLFVLADPDGAIRGTRMLAFPSLCRGGAHYPELLMGLAGRPTDGIAPLDVFGKSEELAAALLSLRRGAAKPLISQLVVDLRGADGTHPLFQPDFRDWLSRVANIPVRACGELGGEARLEYLAEAVGLEPAAHRPSGGGTLEIASDTIPTIGVLAASARAGGSCTGSAMLPLIVAGPDPAQPAILFGPPATDSESIAFGAPDYPPAWPRIIGGASGLPAPLPAAAIRFGRGRPLADSELLVPTMRLPLASPPDEAITWLLYPADWDPAMLPLAIEALSLQDNSSHGQLRLVGPTSEPTIAVAKRLFADRLQFATDTNSALRDLTTPLTGFLGPGVMLHDRRCGSVLAALLQDGAIASASCVLVSAETRGKGWHVSVADAGSFETPPDSELPRPLHPADIEALWRATTPVSSPPDRLWVARSSSLTRLFGRGGRPAAKGGMHLCTSLVTASTIGNRDQTEPRLQLPEAAAGNAVRVEALFG